MMVKKISQLLIAGLLAFSSLSAPAQEGQHQESIDGAMAALDEFMRTFNSKDMDAWASSLNFPHVRFASGTVRVWQNADEFTQDNAFDRLARIDWDHSAWLRREVSLASENKVHINTVFQRYDKDNNPLAIYNSLYIVTKVDGHWGTQARSSLAP